MQYIFNYNIIERKTTNATYLKGAFEVANIDKMF